MTDKDKKPVFEDAFTELRETVESLEAGALSLEAATQLFERGMKLAKACNEMLSTAELQVSRLQRSFGEQMAMMQTPPELPELPEDPDGQDDEDEDDT